MKKTKTVKTKQETKSEPVFEVSLKVFGKNYVSTGKTMKEALESLKFPGKVGGISVMSVKHGTNKRDRILNNVQATRLFSSSRLMKEIAIKNLSILFDNL